MALLSNFKTSDNYQTTLAYLRLMRPANVITAIADILMGFAASGALAGLSFGFGLPEVPILQNLFWLALSTIGLYGGGVVFNDVFDADLDKVERPERPIPSGKASLNGAIFFGLFLLGLGIYAAAQVSLVSILIASMIALSALIYDSISKHNPIMGPINMGVCRGLNLLLGVSCFPETLGHLWPMGLIPLVYIAAITMISRGEVHGGNTLALKGAFFMYCVVIAGIIGLSIFPQYQFLYALPFLAIWGFFIFPPLLKALKTSEAMQIRSAVKSGIMALIVLNATIAAGFAGLITGLIILSLLPLSIFLAKKFAVT